MGTQWFPTSNNPELTTDGDQLWEETAYGQGLVTIGTYLLSHLAEKTRGSYSMNGGLIMRPTRLGQRSGETLHGVGTAEIPDLTHVKEVPHSFVAHAGTITIREYV